MLARVGEADHCQEPQVLLTHRPAPSQNLPTPSLPQHYTFPMEQILFEIQDLANVYVRGYG